MESKRTATTYFIPPGKFLLMENALGNPDLIQSSVSSDCRVTIVDLENFPLDDLEQWPTFRLISSDIKLKLGEGKYHIYIVVPAADNTESTSAFVSYNTRLVDRNGYAQDGTLLGKAGFRYYPCGTVSERGGNPSATTTPSGQGRVVEMDLGVTPTVTNLPGNLSDLEEVFHIEKTDPSNPSSWLMTIVGTVKSMTARIIRVTSSLIFGSGENERPLVGVAVRKDATTPGMVSDTIIATTAWVDAQFEHMDDRYLSKRKDDRTPHNLGVGKSLSVGESVKVGNFVEGTLGSGASTFMRDGSSYSEVDFLRVRKKATFTNITVQELKYIGGEIVLSPAAMVVSNVEELEDGYKCYFDTTDYDGRKVYSYFEVGDQAKCQTFNLEQNQYYWRLVTEVDEEEGYIVLSKTDCDKGSGIPKEGDNISQLGNRTDSSRQSAIILSAYGSDAPSYKQYSGVGATEPYFSLSGKQVTRLSPYGNELTGVLNIEKGSKGWENFEGLPEEIQKAANAIETIEYGKNNLLLNSGFTGDYVTASLVGSTSLKDKSSLFSPSLKYWDVSGSVVVEESKVSESGYEVSMYDDDILEQTLYTKVVPNDSYIFSFRGKGGAIRFTFGEVYHQFDMDDENWGTYSHKFQAPEDVTFLKVKAVGDCNICELQLERGNVRSAWGISPLDNRSELAKYDSLTYLQAALKGDTVVSGGLINTNLINMGMYDEESKMTKTTAGINGLYNEDRSIAFWAGGNSEQAAYTEATYLDNPNYIPTQEELNKMAKFVVTHGGRAILNDIILRGYIYALGGKFKGEVEATSGIFKNVKSPNNHFVIDDSGNVKIVGTIETSFDGKRIVLDAETKSIIMYDEIGRETAKMTFVSDVGESWTYGIIDLKRYVGDSDVVQMESRLTPNKLDINDFSDGWEHHSSFSTDGMQSVSQSNNQSESFFGLSRTYEDYLPVGWETIAKADRFCSGRFQGITESIVINANGANHYLDFVGGILVGYNREDKEE